MDPNFMAYLTQHQHHRHDDGMEREYLVYRAPDDHLRPRLMRATRASLSALFLTLGERLSNDPHSTDPAVEIEPVARTP